MLLENVICAWYKNDSLPQAIIPVPLHYHKYIQRGFNQTFEILNVFNQQLNIPILYDYCIKLKDSVTQTNLNKMDRAKNISQAYVINKNKKYASYKHVAIFDDVVTTMSTIQAVSKIVKANNVKYIDIWCICRA